MMKQFQSQLHQIAMTSLKTDENRLHLACISIVTELPWDVGINLNINDVYKMR